MNEWQSALRLLELRREDIPAPDGVAAEYAIAACAKAGETAAAEGLLRELQDAGVTPAPRAYNQVRNCTPWGRWKCLIDFQ